MTKNDQNKQNIKDKTGEQLEGLSPWVYLRPHTLYLGFHLLWTILFLLLYWSIVIEHVHHALLQVTPTQNLIFVAHSSASSFLIKGHL